MKKKIVFLMLSAVMAISAFGGAGCSLSQGGQDSGDSSASKTGLGYTNNREKYFYGVQESMQACIMQDPMSDPEMTATLAGAMGFSSFRFRMEVAEVMYVDSSGAPQLDYGEIEQYHEYLEMLAEQGITNILMQSTWALQLDNAVVSQISYPRPGADDYLPFMEQVEACYQILAEEFPQIDYWQCGNEPNADFYCNPLDGGAKYSMSEKAEIITDLMYYANKGIKASNPKAALVMPGLCDKQPDMFLQLMYDHIASGDKPEGDVKSTNTDDYFDVLAWHPYNYSDAPTPDYSADSDFIATQKNRYQIAIDNGDEGKKVFFDEFGFTHRGTVWNSAGTSSEELMKMQENSLMEALASIYENLPFVETVHIFRLFDWDNATTPAAIASGATEIEATFGLFTSPGQNASSLGPAPKQTALNVFKLINGEEADTSPLYQYYKG